MSRQSLINTDRSGIANRGFTKYFINMLLKFWAAKFKGLQIGGLQMQGKVEGKRNEVYGNKTPLFIQKISIIVNLQKITLHVYMYRRIGVVKLKD